MLPRNFSKWWVVILVIVVAAVIGSAFFLSRLSKPSSRTNSSADQRVFPTEIVSQINSTLKILYQDPNDTEGRTILYRSEYPFVYNNIGRGIFNTGQIYYTGIIKDWNSNASANQTLTLVNPLTKADIQTFELQFTPNGALPGMKKGTLLSVENLAKSQNPSSLAKDEGVEDYFLFLKPFNKVSSKDLQRWIHTGDAVVVAPLLEEGENGAINEVKGESGYPIAYVILLRRSNGAKDIQ